MFRLTFLSISIRIIENECRKLKIKVPKAGTVKNFMSSLKKLREERRKAENVFLDEVEQDVL
jgi:hypothetical protein